VKPVVQPEPEPEPEHNGSREWVGTGDRAAHPEDVGTVVGAGTEAGNQVADPAEERTELGMSSLLSTIPSELMTLVLRQWSVYANVRLRCVQRAAVDVAIVQPPSVPVAGRQRVDGTRPPPLEPGSSSLATPLDLSHSLLYRRRPKPSVLGLR
jgi:hypothetical protein